MNNAARCGVLFLFAPDLVSRVGSDLSNRAAEQCFENASLVQIPAYSLLAYAATRRVGLL